MNFSKTASYSLNVLSYMAAHEDVLQSAAYLHDKLSIPYPYLRQILASLSKNGFIRSIRGRRGGFEFAREKNQIFLADIIEAVDGLESFYKCILGFRECPFNNQCSMHPIWEETRNNVLRILKETSLADLVKIRD